jgi:aryl-alcohol dehydrogenase-like predicted oxidoreductase
MSAKLALGTAQFGMPYGIKNVDGQVKLESVSRILTLARCAGIEMLDTAIAYGDAEAVLGSIGIGSWKVVTKIPPVPSGVSDFSGWIERQVTGSLDRLGINRLHGLLLHAPGQLRGGLAKSSLNGLKRIASEGLADRVGVSIQSPADDLPIVLRHMTPGIIQAPFNLLDDRLLSQGWGAQLQALGCEVHTRSVFLQGLLLLDTVNRPSWFDQWACHWRVWESWLKQRNLTALEACLGFVTEKSEIDYCLVGVDNVQQLEEILEQQASSSKHTWPVWPTPPDLDLITPSRWPVS